MIMNASIAIINFVIQGIEKLTVGELQRWIGLHLTGNDPYLNIEVYKGENPADAPVRIYQWIENPSFRKRIELAMLHLANSRLNREYSKRQPEEVYELLDVAERIKCESLFALLCAVCHEGSLTDVEINSHNLHQKALLAVGSLKRQIPDFWLDQMGDTRFAETAFSCLILANPHTALTHLPKFVRFCMEEVMDTHQLDFPLILLVKALGEQAESLILQAMSVVDKTSRRVVESVLKRAQKIAIE